VIVEEKQERGTTERTFDAVAQRFETDHSLFADEAGQEGADAAPEMVRTCDVKIIDMFADASTILMNRRSTRAFAAGRARKNRDAARSAH
jgi:hypothetical protein